MSNTPIRTFSHFVSLSKFTNSIDKVMATCAKLVKPGSKSPFMPMLIGIDLEYNGYADSVPVYRKFMKNLRVVHQTHFVRFVTDTLWTMESNNADIFYTCDGVKQDWCDIHWLVKMGQADQVEVQVSIHPSNPQKELLSDILSGFHRLIPGFKGGDADLEAVKKVVLQFFKTTKRFSQAKHLVENLHVLLIPTASKRAFFPLMIYGMTYADAKRRVKAIHTRQETNHRNHADVFTHDYCPGEILGQILQLLVDNNALGARQPLAQDSYNLAENLFSLLAVNDEDITHKHDISLFHIDNLNTLDVSSYRCDVLDFYHVK